MHIIMNGMNHRHNGAVKTLQPGRAECDEIVFVGHRTSIMRWLHKNQTVNVRGTSPDSKGNKYVTIWIGEKANGWVKEYAAALGKSLAGEVHLGLIGAVGVGMDVGSEVSRAGDRVGWTRGKPGKVHTRIDQYVGTEYVVRLLDMYRTYVGKNMSEAHLSCPTTVAELVTTLERMKW